MWVFFTYTHIIGGFVLDKVNWEGTFDYGKNCEIS